MIKYGVFDDGKPANNVYFCVDASYDNSVFENLQEAQNYAIRWLGQFGPTELLLEPNKPWDYSGYGDAIEIRVFEI